MNIDDLKIIRTRLNSTVSFRVTESEKRIIDETASVYDVTVSELLRAGLLTLIKSKRKGTL